MGGVRAVRPLPADVGLRLHHGHASKHLAVLRLLHRIQDHVHAAHHCGHVSTCVIWPTNKVTHYGRLSCLCLVPVITPLKTFFFTLSDK